MSAIQPTHPSAVGRNPDSLADVLERVLDKGIVIAGEQAHTVATVLPVRFATTYRTEQRLRDALAAQHDELTRALDHVRGKVEFGVRVLGEPTAPLCEPTSATSGRGYLEAVATRERATQAGAASAEQAAARVDDVLGHDATDRRASTAGRPGVLVTLAYLVPEGRADAVARAAAALPTRLPDWSVTCTGPWPPYSFAPTGSDDG